MSTPDLPPTNENRNAPESGAGESRDETLSSEAQAAFDRGDYGHARRICDRILKDELVQNSAERERARELLAQLKPSSLSFYVYGLSFALLVLVTLFAYSK